MRNLLIPFFMVIGIPAVIWAQPAADVATPQARMTSINAVKTLLTTTVIDDSDEDLMAKNPFNPMKPVEAGPVERQAAAPAAVSNDREKLRKIADGITPSGTMQLGDDPILLFGQKKFKVGDTLPIIFEGNSYELQISSIERISFTLRLNNEEITRPIKPVANKP